MGAAETVAGMTAAALMADSAENAAERLIRNAENAPRVIMMTVPLRNAAEMISKGKNLSGEMRDLPAEMMMARSRSGKSSGKENLPTIKRLTLFPVWVDL